ncbi:DUF262 domain-containing protein [Leptolyngbya sp. FACHB-671]|uniref:DUF262 domain-containing HNH endonuclease family protein n=1 Tax=Leptolyngbya sp. FACHB-671 TaxID=2692812 RepID=UPI00168602CE|nr:DUF262 domain-containing HNH endonuclease family protein [Leptolyngbya sp. FACHB-671]MBD2069792.1 DUF262 domain-containing protein [Leptolyngbya sp. FACHB-671]
MTTNVSRIYKPETLTVFDLLNEDVGYFVPNYQREYSWDSENIIDLMEDIASGVQELVTEGRHNHFIGTMIIVPKNDPEGLNMDDRRVKPPRTDVIIDGQQRISTIALLGCGLYRKISTAVKRLNSRALSSGARNTIDLSIITDIAVNNYLIYLSRFFSYSVTHPSAIPQKKPNIIRYDLDELTFCGDDSKYTSDVSSYLAQFIRAVCSLSTSLPLPQGKTRVAQNYRAITSSLTKFETAHTSSGSSKVYPSATEILEWSENQRISRDEKPPLWDSLWNHDFSSYLNFLRSTQTETYEQRKQSCLSSLIQLLAFSYYVFDCCCLTRIEPLSETSGFDMFQSLNATGTPLTAIETFKPSVIAYLKVNNISFENSELQKNFSQIEALLKPQLSASTKNKLTNEFLTMFAVIYNGEKLPKRFSRQLKWLTTEYSSCGTSEEHAAFVQRMSYLATYWLNVINYKWSDSCTVIPKLESTPENDLATLCIMMLNDAGHRMAHSVLSRFYSRVIQGVPNAEKDFIEATKAIAAFYVIWRSAHSNSGLDDVYRDLLADKFSWKQGDSQLTPNVLKEYLRNKLRDDKGCGGRRNWREKASINLTYDKAAPACRFALFLTAHDTVASRIAGLMEKGRAGSSSCLTPQMWQSEALNSIEHIAPRKPEPGHTWDSQIYKEGRVERIGNLTLLPIEINISAANRGWLEKWIYYRHLAVTSPTELNSLRGQANSLGVVLADSTILRLRQCTYKQHMESIVSCKADIGANWSSKLIEARTSRICGITWDRIYPWLADSSPAPSATPARRRSNRSRV